jgi:hypothetical protein
VAYPLGLIVIGIEWAANAIFPTAEWRAISSDDHAAIGLIVLGAAFFFLLKYREW